MSAPSDRRGFLRGLVSLPLIGGGVTLIGSPTAAATPITPGMLATYSAWLEYERRALHFASTGSRDDDFIPFCNPGASFHSREAWSKAKGWGDGAQLRAPIILAAAGCPLTSDRAEQMWAETFRLNRHGSCR